MLPLVQKPLQQSLSEEHEDPCEPSEQVEHWPEPESQKLLQHSLLVTQELPSLPQEEPGPQLEEAVSQLPPQHSLLEVQKEPLPPQLVP